MTKLKILLVGNYLPDRQKSMAAFAHMMECVLISAGHDVKLLAPSVCLLPLDKSPVGVWKWIAYIDKFILFPFELRRFATNYDVIHICDHSNAIYALFLNNFHNVVTCHDVLAIESARDPIPSIKVSLTGKVLQWLIFKGLNSTDSVVCVSKYTKEHLINLGWQGRDADVALNALNADFSPSENDVVNEVKIKVGLDSSDRYFIHVGSDLPRKNKLFVLKVFKRLKQKADGKDFKLVLVGPRLSAQMQIYIIDNNLTRDVITLQDASHNSLRALYSGAVATIFPSLQEGFGWPIIEAQACGCPVFTSNFAPMTEVGGEAAIYIDPYDESSAAKVIFEELQNLEAIKSRGFENVSRFSRQNMLSKYLAAYQRVIGEIN